MPVIDDSCFFLGTFFCIFCFFQISKFALPVLIAVNIEDRCTENDAVGTYKHWERSGSVVECLTRDRRAADSSLTGVTALWSLSKTHLS